MPTYKSDARTVQYAPNDIACDTVCAEDLRQSKVMEMRHTTLLMLNDSYECRLANATWQTEAACASRFHRSDTIRLGHVLVEIAKHCLAGVHLVPCPSHAAGAPGLLQHGGSCTTPRGLPYRTKQFMWQFWAGTVLALGSVELICGEHSARAGGLCSTSHGHELTIGSCGRTEKEKMDAAARGLRNVSPEAAPRPQKRQLSRRFDRFVCAGTVHSRYHTNSRLPFWGSTHASLTTAVTITPRWRSRTFLWPRCRMLFGKRTRRVDRRDTGTF